MKSKALIEQYDAFEPRDLPGEHVNGALTVGREHRRPRRPDHRAQGLPDLARGPGDARRATASPASQRLFLNWAYVWRTKRRKELAQQFLTTDPHSPPEFRANIARNLEEFHEAFDVKPGDGLWLDPEDRVRIW